MVGLQSATSIVPPGKPCDDLKESMTDTIHQISRQDSSRGQPLPTSEISSKTHESGNGHSSDTQKEVIRVSAHEFMDDSEEDTPKNRSQQKHLDSTINELETDTYRVNDFYIANAVEKLRFKIIDWSHNFNRMPRGHSWKHFIKDPSSVFLEVTKRPEFYLKPPYAGSLPLLVQSWVWEKLLSEVFDHQIWLGGACLQEESRRVCKSLGAFQILNAGAVPKGSNQEDHETYHHWRAQTCRLIATQAHHKCVEEDIHQIRKIIGNPLKDLFEKEENPNHSDHNHHHHHHDKLKTGLEGIIREAMELDLIIWQQKPLYRFITWDPSGVLDPESMDPRFEIENEEMVLVGQGCSKKSTGDFCKIRVTLIKAPMLVRYGSIEGTEFIKNRLIICKALVDCRLVK